MATIQFETGQRVRFDGNPSPQDVEEVANRLGINKPSKLPPKSLGQKALGVAKGVGGFLGDITGATGIAKGLRFAGETALGKPSSEIVTPGQFLGSVGKAGLTAATFATPGLATGLKGAVGLGARVLESAAIGAGFGTAEALEKRQPIGGSAIGGALLGGALPVGAAAAGKLYEGLFQGLPPQLINRTIKPLLKDLSYGKNPGRGVVKEGITANSLEELEQKISSAVKTRGLELRQVYDKGGATHDLTKAFNPIDKALERAKKSPRTNAGLISRLEDAKKDLLGFQEVKDEVGKVIGEEATRILKNVPDLDAFNLKEDTADITKFTGNRSDDNVVNKALKQVYGSVKESLNRAHPELVNMNEHFADLKSAQVATKYRDLINQRQNFIKLAAGLGFSASVGYGLVTGDWKHAGEFILLEIGGATVSSLAVRSRVAQLLNTMPATDRFALLKEVPAIQRLIGKPK